MGRLWICGCLAMMAAVAGATAAENWAGFRGAGGLGASDEKGLPVRWNGRQNVVWKAELPGPGGSSPIVWNDRVFVTCYSGYGTSESNPGNPANLKRHLICLDRKTGKILWDRSAAGTAATPFDGFQALHGYASSTPATDGNLVFVFFEKEGVFAFDFSGEQVWRASVGQRTHSWGSATSVVLYQDLVIVNASVEDRSLVALDKKTGAERWKARDIRQAWSTPLLVTTSDGKQEIVVNMQGSVVGYDPASGEKLWQCRGVQDYVCPSAVAAGGVVYAIGGRQNTAVAVKAGGRGEVEPLWTQTAGSNVSSPVVAGDHLFWVSDRGIAHCLNRHTGEVVYKERLPGSRVEGYASALAADGKIYNVTRSTGTFVLAAKPKFDVLATNVLDNSICNASPAVSGKQLIMRTNLAVYCVGK